MGKTKTQEEEVRKEIYQIVDSFLVEAKDQNGNERTLERLNMDRHLAVDKLASLFQAHDRKRVEEIKRGLEMKLTKKQKKIYPLERSYDEDVIEYDEFGIHSYHSKIEDKIGVLVDKVNELISAHNTRLEEEK